MWLTPDPLFVICSLAVVGTRWDRFGAIPFRHIRGIDLNELVTVHKAYCPSVMLYPITNPFVGYTLGKLTKLASRDKSTRASLFSISSSPSGKREGLNPRMLILK
jgi:hypothetical protein